jgi:hypothetical protein
MVKGKEAAKLTMTFAKVLLTENPMAVGQKPSIIHILRTSSLQINPMGQLLDWASRHILSVVKPLVDMNPTVNTDQDGNATPTLTTNQDDGVARSPADMVSQTTLEVLVELVALRKEEAADEQ